MNNTFATSGVGTQLKSFSLSFAIHALIFLAFMGVSRSIPVGKPIVIDFSIESSTNQTISDVMPAKKEAVTREKASRMPRPINNELSQPNNISQAIPETQTPAIEPVSEALPSHDALEEQGSEQQTEQGAAPSNISDTATDSSSGISTGETSEKTKARYIELNYAYIKDKIQKSISYPLMARKMGMEGKVIISFIVRESGDAEDIKILKSSGFNMLDKNVMETIKKMPFPAPHVSTELIVPVTYRLN